ncbi:polysaccharide lyase family 7 protein [Winogradskyella immobilis]|uniref:Polysaccharide lyase family 7 protein n=1 Tax=Winogradskyella immobilis TaxID=2816852 RepID=A0ABS8ELY2_9FLAO|nr:polysaccharide lyase family 7 protein [Winogradskyella immobilis]MCC1484022.1 polysaccharide lyase family 7 protein [Winogradskyella immobilis]MCG0016114.1 polysaccharide lyase family 7 protein [Winogradskyella immobilis]
MRKYLALVLMLLAFYSCKQKNETTSEVNEEIVEAIKIYPSDVLPIVEECKILLGDGTSVKDLKSFQKEDFFYVKKEQGIDWVVYKAPNAGVTSKTSKNTRSELHQKKYWRPMQGGRLTGTLKVKNVSTTGDATVSSSYAVVIGQIHGDEGHKNEPLKIFYKKFPGHTKGSVFWNYEINHDGDNSGRWDFSTAVWGYDFSVVGETENSYPTEPKDGIALGEEFSYEVNIYQGVMYLTFTSKNHETKTFTKSLVQSEFADKASIPEQIKNTYFKRGRDGVEKESAYAGELQYFKQGAYNQANPKSTKSQVYDGDIDKQYQNGSYAEVWFKEGALSIGVQPKKDN